MEAITDITRTQVLVPWLELDYTSHAGCRPTGAQSARKLHPWCQHDDIYLAAEFSVERCEGRDAYYVWGADITRRGGAFSTDVDSVVWYRSPELLTFTDAEEFCQFAFQRWCATGRLSASGMKWQAHLDANRNPHPVC